MAEAIVDSGQVVDEGVRSTGRPPEPPPDSDRAPMGWTWDRKGREWRPRQRSGRKPKDDDSTTPAARTDQRRPPGRRRRDTAPDPDAETSEGVREESGGWQAERDPEPARLADDDRKTRLPDNVLPPPREIPQDVKEDIEGSIGLVGMAVLPPIMKADPVCGGALVESWDKVAEACVPLICRSERVVSWMTGAGGLRDWLGLALALKPVGSAIIAHHVTHSVRVEETQQGRVVVEQDFSVYPAA